MFLCFFHKELTEKLLNQLKLGLIWNFRQQFYLFFCILLCYYYYYFVFQPAGKFNILLVFYSS